MHVMQATCDELVGHVLKGTYYSTCSALALSLARADCSDARLVQPPGMFHRRPVLDPRDVVLRSALHITPAVPGLGKWGGHFTFHVVI